MTALLVGEHGNVYTCVPYQIKLNNWTKQKKDAGVDSDGGTFSPPPLKKKEGEREGRKNIHHKGTAAGQVETVLVSFFITLGQSPWRMAMCLVWQSVLLGEWLKLVPLFFSGRTVDSRGGGLAVSWPSNTLK